ncbi:MAG: DUF4199 domain-containing protein [Flavobacterium sp.]|nr:DUF4199 domain-containing protein [Flavobacterium sp.]MBP8157505.1 DUF4199 domain-containing protein [Flavobacterium sp.]
MEKNSSKSLIISYGILLGIVSILMAVLKYVLSSNYLEKNYLETVIGILITIAFIVIPIYTYRKNNNGLLSLSQSIKIGLGVAAIAGLIGAVYFFIFANYIQPEFADNLLNVQMKEAMESNPNVSSAQMEEGMQMAKKFMMPMFYAMVVISNLFFGLIISLIAGLILRKE